MAKLSKRRRAINEKVEEGKLYPVAEALSLLKELPAVKFNETVDVAINLGIDARKSDQIVRGATTLPNGSGKAVRVCVFAQGDAAEAAKAAGAEFVGMDELANEVKGGMMDFDVVVAAPVALRFAVAPAVPVTLGVVVVVVVVVVVHSSAQRMGILTSSMLACDMYRSRSCLTLVKHTCF